MATSYETIILNDTGAVEFPDNYFDSGYNFRDYLAEIKEFKDFPKREIILTLEMYDDKEFNSLNDFIDSPVDFIVNEKVKGILKEFHLPPHRFLSAKILRKEKGIFFKKVKEYYYYWFCLDCENTENYYKYIDFEKSEINFYKNENKIDNFGIKNIFQLYSIVDQNKLLSGKVNQIFKQKNLTDYQKREQAKNLGIVTWEADSIVLNNKFNRSIDVFRLPLFSWMTYVSERLKERLLNDNITDIKFVQTGIKSRLEGVKNPKLMVE